MMHRQRDLHWGGEMMVLAVFGHNFMGYHVAISSCSSRLRWKTDEISFFEKMVRGIQQRWKLTHSSTCFLLLQWGSPGRADTGPRKESILDLLSTHSVKLFRYPKIRKRFGGGMDNIFTY